MNKLTGLLKDHQVGEWCKRAAWIIAAVGLIDIVFTISSLVVELQQLQGSYNFSPGLEQNLIYMYVAPLIETIALIIFFFFALYAAGVFLNHFVTDTQDNNKEEEARLIAEAERAYLQPGCYTDVV